MPADSQPILEVRSVTKTFGGLTALKDVSMTVQRGEICGVIGPNGAGKSTLFGVIAGSPPTSGQVIFAGNDVTQMPMYKRTHMGIVRTFQLAYVFESMTVEENIIVGAEDHARLKLLESVMHIGSYRESTIAARQRASQIMSLVGVNALAQTSAGQLTFGQQRLVATGRALASDPQLLLLDEPAAGLSGTDIDALARAVLHARERGATVLLVEHNMDVIMRLCDHIIVMHLGETIGDGTPDAVRQSERVLEAYLGT